MAIILVMSRKSLRRTAFAHYLIAIAVCDLIAIWVALVRHFIKNAFQVSKPNSWHQPLLRNDYRISCMHMHAAGRIVMYIDVLGPLARRGRVWGLRLISKLFWITLCHTGVKSYCWTEIYLSPTRRENSNLHVREGVLRLRLLLWSIDEPAAKLYTVSL